MVQDYKLRNPEYFAGKLRRGASTESFNSKAVFSDIFSAARTKENYYNKNVSL